MHARQDAPVNPVETFGLTANNAFFYLEFDVFLEHPLNERLLAALGGPL